MKNYITQIVTNLRIKRILGDSFDYKYQDNKLYLFIKKSYNLDNYKGEKKVRCYDKYLFVSIPSKEEIQNICKSNDVDAQLILDHNIKNINDIDVFGEAGDIDVVIDSVKCDKLFIDTKSNVKVLGLRSNDSTFIKANKISINGSMTNSNTQSYVTTDFNVYFSTLNSNDNIDINCNNCLIYYADINANKLNIDCNNLKVCGNKFDKKVNINNITYNNSKDKKMLLKNNNMNITTNELRINNNIITRDINNISKHRKNLIKTLNKIKNMAIIKNENINNLENCTIDKILVKKV